MLPIVLIISIFMLWALYKVCNSHGSITIPEWMVVNFGDTVKEQFQQEASRLRNACTVRTNVVGKSTSFNRIGLIEAATKATRHEQHSHQNPEHSVRWANLIYMYNAAILDPDDEVRIITDPTNRYTKQIVNALGRAVDRAVITALLGTATSGEDRTGSVTLASWLSGTHVIAAGGTGFTLAKWLQAKRLMDESEVPDGQRYLGITAQGLEDLLDDPEVTSSDFNSVKALVSGQLNTYLGFEIIREQLWPKVSTTRSVAAWHKDAIGLAFARDMHNRVATRVDMHDAVEAYGAADFGAVRIEEAGVVKIDFIES